MLQLISKVSKGTKMDQIYLTKNRAGMQPGSYVIVQEVPTLQPSVHPVLYGVSRIEPIKMRVIQEIFTLLEKMMPPHTCIIGGSFLNKGFNFEDIDMFIIAENILSAKYLGSTMHDKFGIAMHIVPLTPQEYEAARKAEPLLNLALSKCVSSKRLPRGNKRVIRY